MSKRLNFRIVLIESKPIIWRAFQVTDDYRLDRFHQVIQIVMGWQNSHLHEFRFGKRQIGMLDDWSCEYAPNLEDETKIFLRDFNLEEKDVFTYEYDFGDSWKHVLYVESAFSGKKSDPVCSEGSLACPPEDCGGVWGYSDLLTVLKDPTHPEYDGFINWLPDGFDPYHFSVETVNTELKKFGAWHRKHPRKKSTPWHQLQ